MQGTRWLTLLGTSVLIASCVVLSPLDEVKTRTTDGGAGTGGDASFGRCQTHTECSANNLDEWFRCDDGQCVPLKSPECTLVYDGKDGKDRTDPNPVYLGAFANYGDSPGQGHDVFNYQLALRELSGTNNKGVPGPNSTYRPVVLVVCNNADSRADRVEVVQRGFEHLVNRLHVPAILAAVREEDLLDHFGTFGRSTNTFFLTPFGANRRLADEQDNGLLWHMLGLPSQVAPTYLALVERLEQRLKAQRPALTNIKVAVVESGLGFDAELSSLVLDDLKFNDGKSVAQNQQAGHYLSQRILAGTDLTAVSNAIKAFAPNIVLSLAGDDFTDTLLPDLEPMLGVDGTYFVLSPVNLGAMAKVKVVIENAVGLDSKAARRYLGVNIAGAENTDLYGDYLNRLLRDFPRARAGTENYYDAMYFLVYALHAGAPTGDAGGSDVVDGIKRLMEPGGTAYNVGADDVSNVYGSLLVSSNRIYLTGTLGPPDFNRDTGVRNSSGSVLCFEHTLGQAVVITEHPDTLRTDSAGALQFSSGFTPITAPCLDDELDYVPLH